ncbi:MAG: 3-deoxy-D-manno-octulosonic acid transferase [Deltaproteobacteria bacterium]|nr:3-deoxy-D-manno-octulosonic acid transferase [Deltaproteobacteria bacterium]
MLYILYNVVTLLALPVIACSLLLQRKYRNGFVQRIGVIPREVRTRIKGRRPIWLHAVSVGEVLASVPIIKKIKSEHPDVKIVLSTITNTGNYTARQKVPEADCIIYFPYDYFFIVNRVIRIINPLIFIHTETEIWPNFLLALEHHHIPSVIVNGRISLKSCRRYKVFGWFFRHVFNKISAFGMQSLIDYQRVIEIGAAPEKVLLTGNMKFDQKIAPFFAQEKRRLLEDFYLNAEDKVFIAGSTHSGEEEIILDTFAELLGKHPRLVLVLAPRHPERFQEVEKLVKNRGFELARRTQMKEQMPLVRPRVILLDTIGELSHAYALGDVIFVGGSLVNIGGHNILEPLVHKKPVIFGPNMQNFPEITLTLKESGAGLEVASREELLAQVERLLSNESEAGVLGERGFAVIRKHQGATDRNMDIINQFINR